MKIILVILTVLFLIGIAEARTDSCHWVFAATDVNSAPTSVYCSLDGGAYASRGTGYIQNADGATTITVTYNTTSTGADLTVDGVTVVDNGTTTPDINILVCTDGTCSTGTTTVAYHQVNDIADAIANGFSMTPVTSFKITVDEEASGTAGVLVTTVVTW